MFSARLKKPKRHGSSRITIDESQSNLTLIDETTLLDIACLLKGFHIIIGQYLEIYCQKHGVEKSKA